MRYDNVEQQIPCRILNRRLLNRSDGIRRLLIRSDGLHGPVASVDLLDFFRRLLNRSDGLHGPGRGDQPLPAAGANPLGGDLLRGFDIIRHSAVSREGAFCGLYRTGIVRTGLYRRLVATLGRIAIW